MLPARRRLRTEWEPGAVRRMFHELTDGIAQAVEGDFLGVLVAHRNLEGPLSAHFV